ncbi:MAG TPA: YihY/virulence factor BrkB family protein [Thermoanaerobaculia bacterium]|nr:YihY/virulence factor BrkB family protein [Thermoanaerobaculia bacterium]
MGPPQKAPGYLADLRGVFRNWSRHRDATHAAALAFYTLVSLAPTLALLLHLLAGIFGEQAVQQRITREFQLLMGADAAEVVEGVLASAARPDLDVPQTLLWISALLFGATIAFAQLQDSLNIVWEVEPRPGTWIRFLVRKRLLSFGMVLVVGLLLLVSLVASAVIATLYEALEERYRIPGDTLRVANFWISLVLIALLFALVFRILPDAELGWREVVFAAIVTSLLFAAGKWAIGLYLAQRDMASAYGAAGSLVVFLLWLYYSSLILLFGAELSRVHSRRFRSRPVLPAPGARRTDDAEPPGGGK